jgi:hypothetical protein
VASQQQQQKQQQLQQKKEDGKGFNSFLKQMFGIRV